MRFVQYSMMIVKNALSSISNAINRRFRRQYDINKAGKAINKCCFCKHYGWHLFFSRTIDVGLYIYWYVVSRLHTFSSCTNFSNFKSSIIFVFHASTSDHVFHRVNFLIVYSYRFQLNLFFTSPLPIAFAASWEIELKSTIFEDEIFRLFEVLMSFAWPLNRSETPFADI